MLCFESEAEDEKESVTRNRGKNAREQVPIVARSNLVDHCETEPEEDIQDPNVNCGLYEKDNSGSVECEPVDSTNLCFRGSSQPSPTAFVKLNGNSKPKTSPTIKPTIVAHIPAMSSRTPQFLKSRVPRQKMTTPRSMSRTPCPTSPNIKP